MQSLSAHWLEFGRASESGSHFRAFEAGEEQSVKYLHFPVISGANWLCIDSSRVLKRLHGCIAVVVRSRRSQKNLYLLSIESLSEVKRCTGAAIFGGFFPQVVMLHCQAVQSPRKQREEIGQGCGLAFLEFN